LSLLVVLLPPNGFQIWVWEVEWVLVCEIDEPSVC